MTLGHTAKTYWTFPDTKQEPLHIRQAAFPSPGCVPLEADLITITSLVQQYRFSLYSKTRKIKEIRHFRISLVYEISQFRQRNKDTFDRAWTTLQAFKCALSDGHFRKRSKSDGIYRSTPCIVWVSSAQRPCFSSSKLMGGNRQTTKQTILFSLSRAFTLATSCQESFTSVPICWKSTQMHGRGNAQISKLSETFAPPSWDSWRLTTRAIGVGRVAHV